MAGSRIGAEERAQEQRRLRGGELREGWVVQHKRERGWVRAEPSVDVVGDSSVLGKRGVVQ